jgi:hypothetical protein
MGDNVNEKFVADFYKVQDEEVKVFLKELYIAQPGYWEKRYKFFSGFTFATRKHEMSREYLQGLVRRRFGFRLSTENNSAYNGEFYNPESNLVLARSGEESKMPRNWREFNDLFLFIATEAEYAIKEELVETYVKPSHRS